MAFFITGDCHGGFTKFGIFCRNHRTDRSDTMIVLGDVALNYDLGKGDRQRKEILAALPLTFFCIHGNHEERPFNIPSYQEKEWKGGIVYFEPEFPNLLFAKDGEIYDLDGKKAIVIGGAYSIDKEYRLMYGYAWFPDEQPSAGIKRYVEQRLDEVEWKADYVFSHTCPFKYQPTDLFLEGYDQSKVDASTEEWLERIEKKLHYEKWYFGHYHENREYAHAVMLYEEIRELGAADFIQRLGRPKYRMGERVMFYPPVKGGKVLKYGRISVVDAYGTFGQAKEVSYDILTEEDSGKMLYKHIEESRIEGKM